MSRWFKPAKTDKFAMARSNENTDYPLIRPYTSTWKLRNHLWKSHGEVAPNITCTKTPLPTDQQLQGSLYYQPKQCTIIRLIPQNYHIFALFDPPKDGSHLMTPELWRVAALFKTVKAHCDASEMHGFDFGWPRLAKVFSHGARHTSGAFNSPRSIYLYTPH